MRPNPQRQAPRDWSRRDLGRAVVAAGSIAWLSAATRAAQLEGSDESPLGRFCRALSAEQRRVIVLPGDDPRRTMVQNHWTVVPMPIASLTAEQQELAMNLIRQVCTAEGFAHLTRQRLDDAGGWKHDHLAVFGSPADPKRFEWVLTGRHLTIRGSSTGATTGGPLFYGHTATGSANIGHKAIEAAGTLFRALDADQQRQAVRPAGSGLSLADLVMDQQPIARQLLASLSEPFRAFDVPAVEACSRGSSGWSGVRWEAYRPGADRDGDPPRIWRLLGPGFTWSFHAEPHVHCWFDSV